MARIRTKVMEKKSYSFKYLLPPAKASVYSSYCGDAMDVNNAADFVDMAKKIMNLSQVGNTDVDAVTKITMSNTGPGSDLERAIAHFQRLIIKQWGNEYDNMLHTSTRLCGYTLYAPDDPRLGNAMHEGTATKLQPPNIQSFDPQKTAVALIPTRRLHTPAPAASNITPTPSSSEISALTSALLLQAAQGLSRDRNSPHTPSQTITSTPATSAAPTTQPQSPAIPTPSKLTRFLEYADTQLGVQHATTYEHALNEPP
ncbi:hypothetical protein BU15DRAFT_65137 [Melanogaster broomeanus]|nr:hypothetical protein BU15DRAFT_65137 [Melanogaster broomeanus]